VIPGTDTFRLRKVTRGRRVRAAGARTLLGLLVIAAAGCDKSTATSPTSTTSATSTTTTVADPTTTELFAGRVNPGGFTFYSFTVTTNGTVNVTLAAVGGANVPSTVWLGLGIGTPTGEDCSTTATINTAAGTAVQLTGTYAPGVYCVRVWDIGNLFATAAFNVTISHP
jgi:hypothetical protein